MDELDLSIRDAAICHSFYRVPDNLYKLGKACDEWLAKRYAAEGRRAMIHTWKKAETYRPPAPEKEAKTRALARAIRQYNPKAPKAPKPVKERKPPKPRAPRVRDKKYATEAERKAAISAAMKAVWENMTPQERAERTAKTKRKIDPKWNGVPRHKREAWKEYKRAYDRNKRREQSLCPEAVAKRRADARRQYAARDPELRKAQGARRRAAHKAKKAALKAALKAAA